MQMNPYNHLVIGTILERWSNAQTRALGGVVVRIIVPSTKRSMWRWGWTFHSHKEVMRKKPG